MEVPLEELRRLTRSVHARKVCRVLARLGVAYKLDEDKNPIVLRESIDRAFGLSQHSVNDTNSVNIDDRLQRLKEVQRGKKAPKRSRPAA